MYKERGVRAEVVTKSNRFSMRNICFSSCLFPRTLHFSDLQFGCNSLATNTYSARNLVNFLLISLKETFQLRNEKWSTVWKGK